MIPEPVLARIRDGTCAVGYLTVPLEVYKRDPLKPFFKVVGTGFLVRPDTAVTNRHVIEGLLEDQLDLGFPDKQRMVLFVASGRSGLQVVIRMMRALHVHGDPNIDVGFIQFQREPVAQFKGIEPFECQDNWKAAVTEEVAVCGYPYGHAMLQRGGTVYRWGPVVQQGHISAVSPFDSLQRSMIPSELLLDVRVAEGMSGAAVFRPSDGRVLGIVHSACEATTALALPLTNAIVGAWLSGARTGPQQPGSVGAVEIRST